MVKHKKKWKHSHNNKSQGGNNKEKGTSSPRPGSPKSDNSDIEHSPKSITSQDSLSPSTLNSSKNQDIQEQEDTNTNTNLNQDNEIFSFNTVSNSTKPIARDKVEMEPKDNQELGIQKETRTSKSDNTVTTNHGNNINNEKKENEKENENKNIEQEQQELNWNEDKVSLNQDMSKLVDGIVEDALKNQIESNKNRSDKDDEIVSNEIECPKDNIPVVEPPSFVFNLGDEVETPYGLAEIIQVRDPILAKDTKLINRYVLQSTCWIMDGNVRPTYYLLESQIKRLTIEYLQKVSPMTLIRRADIGRIRGNEYFLQKDFAKARDEYLKAHWFLMSFTEDKTAKAEEINSFKAHKFSIIIPLFNNLATVYNKLESFKDSIVSSRNSVRLLEELSRQERKINQGDLTLGSGSDENKDGDLHVGGTEVIRLLRSSPINWDSVTIKKHQQKALMVLGTAYHFNQEYENSNIYLKLCNDPKQQKYVANLITKNNQKIKTNNNKLSAAFSKSLSSSDANDNNNSRKHKLSPSGRTGSPSKKKIKQMSDNDRISSKRNDDKEGSTGSRIRNWCRQNKNLVYLGAAVVTLGAAYTVVMMRKKKQ